jgi:rRNA-processing protein FCF1
VTNKKATGRPVGADPDNVTVPKITRPESYVQVLLRQLQGLETAFIAVIETSGIHNVDPNRRYAGSGVAFMGYAKWSWTASEPQHEGARMRLLASLRDWHVRYRLLFAHPTPALTNRLDEAFTTLERWLERPGRDHSVPSTIGVATDIARKHFATLRSGTDVLEATSSATRLIVDTNTLIDDPDLTVYRPVLGDAYTVHILPVVMRELDEHKRNGRNPDIREWAKRADRRLKGLRDNGDVTVGARVAGNVLAIFEHQDPRSDSLPSWLDLDVADDRLVAATLLLQSAHPADRVYVATSDLNLQTKLAAVGMPFLEPPS